MSNALSKFTKCKVLAHLAVHLFLWNMYAVHYSSRVHCVFSYIFYLLGWWRWVSRNVIPQIYVKNCAICSAAHFFASNFLPFTCNQARTISRYCLIILILLEMFSKYSNIWECARFEEFLVCASEDKVNIVKLVVVLCGCGTINIMRMLVVMHIDYLGVWQRSGRQSPWARWWRWTRRWYGLAISRDR